MTNQMKNTTNTVETDIKLIGDATVNSQIVMFLAFVRDILNNNKCGTITVSIGKNLMNDEFAFSVNDQEIQQIIAQDHIEIS